MSNSVRAIYGFCIVLTAVIVIALVREVFFPPQLILQNLQLLSKPKPLISVDLNHAGGEINIRELQSSDDWGLLFFGYTYCPDVCPLELQKLGKMLKNLEKQPLKQKVLVALVSVDPERDKPEGLKEYTEYFHSGILGLTGANIELAKLARFFGASYNRMVKIGDKEYLVEAGADMPEGSGEGYQVNHSARIFVINPKGEYVGSFSQPYTVEQITADMQTLIAF